MKEKKIIQQTIPLDTPQVIPSMQAAQPVIMQAVQQPIKSKRGRPKKRKHKAAIIEPIPQPQVSPLVQKLEKVKEYDENGKELTLGRKLGKLLFQKKNMSSTEFAEIVKKQEIITYKHEGFFKFLSIDRIKEWYKKKYFKGRIFLIELHLRNGMIDRFTIKNSEPYFERRGGMYFIDPNMAKYDLHTNRYMLTYHQDFAAPFLITFNTDEIHGIIEQSDENKMVDKMLAPSTFKAFITTDVIEKLLNDHELSDKLKFLLILIVINLVISVILCFIVAKGFGML